MELSKGRKALYIILSLAAAFGMWFYVNGSSDVDLPIDDIPVEFVNAESALANKGLVLISGDDASVDLVLTMPRDLVYNFDAEHLHLYANLSSVNSTGTQSIAYSIAYPPGVNPSQISVKSPTVQTVSVRVGEPLDLFAQDIQPHGGAQRKARVRGGHFIVAVQVSHAYGERRRRGERKAEQRGKQHREYSFFHL